jgi:hypothetical protein
MYRNRMIIQVLLALIMCTACSKKNAPPPYAGISGIYLFDGEEKYNAYSSTSGPISKNRAFKDVVIVFNLISDSVVRVVSKDSAVLIDTTFTYTKTEGDEYTFSNDIHDGFWGVSYNARTGKRGYLYATTYGYVTAGGTRVLNLTQQ